MKKISIFLVVILLMNVIGPLKVLADEQPIKVSINGKLIEFDVPPTIINGRTLVPVRAIFELFFLDVEWDGKTQTINAYDKYGNKIKMRINDKIAYVNGMKYELDVPPTIINGRTLVPVRFIAENFNTIVNWDGETRTVKMVTRRIINPKPLYVEPSQLYMPEQLEKLVEETECSQEVMKFRTTPNKAREELIKAMGNDVKKYEGKYFDIYYHDDETGNEMLNYVKGHMDKIYMMLADLYQQQPPVEVYFIYEDEYSKLRKIRDRYSEHKVQRFVYPYTRNKEGNTIESLIHEIDHIFFKYANGSWNWTVSSWIPFIEEANVKLISSMYLHRNYDGKADYWDLYSPSDFKSVKEFDDISILKAYKIAWQENSTKESTRVAIQFFHYLFDKYGMEKYKLMLRTVGSKGQKNFKQRLEEIYGKSIEELNKEFVEFIKGLPYL
ncbi:copper amine oxidase N-terminal domain-containing protein [Caminicella sporogenes]|uniref:copper amine oxidase N-terminal domain-containing protein n=1 Tax=Caminicella sporogenes TaxID=166485 RepID=UPI0025404D02|nr:copper amine oxidase N-terminal domain-containing protein [Caminicella sporogenes]WIF94461.1 copper amine oxidase N-terminal domain-containing protein [Caminicella sporogenes]